jgi:methionyl-tRNA formyltransferase
MIAHRFSMQHLSKIPTQSALDRVCSRYNVPLHSVRNPNSSGFVEFIREREVDILVSFQPWILGEQILAAPNVMCMNVHTGILPGYRGLRPIFRMICDNLPELGITVHTMTHNIDAGRVLETVRWCNKPGTTLVENSRLAYNAAATGVLAALDRIERGEVEDLPIIPENSPYFAEPTYSEVRAARKQGLRF